MKKSNYEERLLEAKKKSPRKLCTRSPESWCQILLFYFLFYTFLTFYWSVCFYVFLDNFISEKQPTWTLEQSRIAGFGSKGVKPGIALMPRIPSVFDTDHGRQYNLNLDDKWTSENSSPNSVWARKIYRFLDDLNNQPNSTLCDKNDHDYHENDTCRFDLSELGPECSRFPYGYMSYLGKSSPCLYFKLNRILKYRPEPFEESQFSKIPTWIKIDTIQMNMLTEPRKVYVECHGLTKDEDDKIRGHVRYFPKDAGISYRYFPYHRVRNQKSPLVAMQFLPSFPRNQKIRMECYVYFKNVVHDRLTRQGLVQFNVKINT